MSRGAETEQGWMARLARRTRVSRYALWIIRGEIEGVSARLQAAVRPSLRRAVRDLRARRDVLANIGCGPYPLADFVNVDLRRFSPDTLVWDCRRSLPFTTDSCRGIRIEHFVEHVDPRDELPSLLRECRRALVPGGVLRIIVPDAGRLLLAYAQGGRAAFDALGVPNPFPSDLPSAMDVVNHTFHQWHEHRWAYDEENLTARLHDSGFATTCRARFGESQLPPLAEDRKEHAPYSLYVEAIK
jgi:predicted SAM-dependent methyltransferase